MAITYLDGLNFRESIIASARRILQAEDYLNKINVFPVPDGDTGTNMVVTMNSIANGAAACQQESFAELSTAIADSALSGARGNSGAILAQFFQGLAEATQDKIKLTTRTFAEAARQAVDKAYEALANPREGTILTVMRDWAGYLGEKAGQTADFNELFTSALQKAKQSLSETPEKLRELKNAGVVDAGALGFVHLLEGIVDFMEVGKITMLKKGAHVKERFKSLHLENVDVDLSYRYCTECLVIGSDINLKALREQLSDLGNSLIVVGSERKVRVHIHTNTPDDIFVIVEKFGVLESRKTDDMREQYLQSQTTEKKKAIALVTDSTCDLPQTILDKYPIHIIPVLIQKGMRTYHDGVDLKTAEFYDLLRSSKEKLTTSQPPPGDFKQMYEKLADEYRDILSIHLSSRLSGTFQGACLGAKGTPFEKQVHFIDSLNITAGLGFLVLEAARMIEEGKTIREIVTALEKLKRGIKLFINLPTLKYIMRSGRLSIGKGLVATALNVKPIISITPEGRLKQLSLALGRKKMERKTLQLALNYAQTLNNPQFMVGHVQALEVASRYRRELQHHFGQKDIPLIEAGPALAVHTGIGSAGIAVMDAGK